MPMRGELAVPAARPDRSEATDDSAWAVIAFCTIGWLISIYFALQVLTVGDVAVLYSQAFWG